MRTEAERAEWYHAHRDELDREHRRNVRLARWACRPLGHRLRRTWRRSFDIVVVTTACTRCNLVQNVDYEPAE